MGEKIDNGGPAFPSGELDMDDCKTAYAPGMSLRDWFAGKALAGLGTWTPNARYTDRAGICFNRAEWAYEQADTMLEVRNAACAEGVPADPEREKKVEALVEAGEKLIAANTGPAASDAFADLADALASLKGGENG